MNSVLFMRLRGLRLVRLVSLLFLTPCIAPSTSAAFEAVDGRFQAHGYFEMQMRTMNKGFDDQWDMTQWYNIFNLELEFEFVRDTHGPLDLLEAFVRIEGRYDCIYSHGCGMLNGVDLYGNEARRMPSRLNAGDEYTHAGNIFISKDGPLTDSERNPYGIKEIPGFRGIYEGTPEGLEGVDRRVLLRCGASAQGEGGTAFCDEFQNGYWAGRIQPRFWGSDRNRRIADENGDPIDDGTAGAPYLIAMDRFKDFKFASLPVIGGSGNGFPLLLMGPWLPKNYVETNAALADLPNPLDQSRISPQSLSAGFGANPMRPIPVWREDDAGRHHIYLLQEQEANPALPDLAQATGRLERINPLVGEFSDLRDYDRAARPHEARGIFVPSAPLRQALNDGMFSPYPFNISETNRAFNRGASQQDEGELKEAYFDIEMFDSRLWLRLGKQNIVWGKTELFRTTDQFNPQDFALSTLPNLEESRIGLWALRGVWSFYEVGPLSDVRLELAMNFDQFEPADLGACGEPYAVNLICALTLGSWAHGLTGIGVAGFVTPPNPWDDADGIEFGARLEWRWDRFSFALTDFYGYDDFPHPIRLHSYNRNVDWHSGRPRFSMFSPAEMAAGDRGCASPTGDGIQFADNGSGESDFYQRPTGVGARIGFDGADESGCLTPGPTSRQVRVLTALDGDALSGRIDLLRERAGSVWGVDPNETWFDDKGTVGTFDDEVVQVVSWQIGAGRWEGSIVHRPPPGQAAEDPIALYNADGTLNDQLVREAERDDFQAQYGVPLRVDPRAQFATPTLNSLYHDAGVWLNDSARGDPEDWRRYYSSPKTSGVPSSGSDWPDGPQAGLCETDSRLKVGGTLHPHCTEGSSSGARGRRIYDTSRFVAWDPDDAGPEETRLVPNPRYNPFYDPRFDRYFDAGEFNTVDGGDNLFDRQANPGDVIAAADLDGDGQPDPVLFDPFRVFEDHRTRGHMLWANAYDPTLANYDARNSLDVNSINQSLFNWVCSVTVGFSDLDPSACALTVFSSSKQPGGSVESAPRISTLISAFVAGNPGFNGFVGKFPSDSLLSKGPLLPEGMGMPLLRLHDDMGSSAPESDPNNTFAPRIGLGLDAFRTADVRRDWADRVNGDLQSDGDYRWIYAREGESYNCLGPAAVLNATGALHLCGGLEINLEKPDNGAFNVGIFLARALTPEQEALLGCGPYFGTSCDANGMDLMWAEGSAALQSFVGGDSLGIDLVSLGIADLVAGGFGSHLMDNGSLATEYRTDGRVIGNNGRLIRIDEATLAPVLGSAGFRVAGNVSFVEPVSEPCDLKLENADGSVTGLDRMSARCWDLRRYYRAYGLQPGTATFEILGLGGPKCTTADIGGPLDPIASMLPGCRNKWATIQYQPLDSWDGLSELHPNNPDAGYIGNNWYGQVFSYKADRFDTRIAPSQRRDYRQWSNDSVDHGVGDELADDVSCGSGDPGDPENYDCYLRNPTDYGLPENLGVAASVRLDSKWAGDSRFDAHYNAALESQRSGLNWGVYDPTQSGCDPSGSRGDSQLRNDPNCYLGGWSQTVDGDPDRLGIDNNRGQLLYPDLVLAEGTDDLAQFGGLASLAAYGQRVEGGCTPGSTWIYLQRTESGELLAPPECAQVFRNPNEKLDGTRWLNALRGGAGHPFTGESFSSEMAGVSFNLMMLLVTFSEEFTDGLASVRGFVNPELYESRYIYDEEWMWNPDCDGNLKSAEDCGGRLFVSAPNENPGDRFGVYSAYGDPNRDPLNANDLNGDGFSDVSEISRVRQVAGWRSLGLYNGQLDRETKIPNPIPDDVAGVFQTGRITEEVNKLQRDPSLPNIMTMFPDLLMRECNSARMNTDPGKSLRELYADCGKSRPGEANDREKDWTKNAAGQYYQELRLGNRGGDGGLVESMLWDYAFTGTENDLMAMIPYCENISYTQRHLDSVGENGAVATGQALYGPSRIDCTKGLEGETLGKERCTYITPQYCGIVQAISGIAGQKRNVLRAGGNGRFGRRTMQWQSGSEIYLGYDRRNVLGFSMDFAEDYTKSNWSMEFTWIGGRPFSDADSYDFNTEIDEFNLTVSVDRPTFVNFLNANRTLFFNSQWFFQYRKGYKDSFSSIGPWNVLATFAVFTGYFQDRLNPTLVFVWDFRSRSGGVLPQLNYRFSENFSVTVGASIFTGKQSLVTMGLNPIAPSSARSGPNAYMDGSEPGLALVRDRDEVFMSLRYTF